MKNKEQRGQTVLCMQTTRILLCWNIEIQTTEARKTALSFTKEPVSSSEQNLFVSDLQHSL